MITFAQTGTVLLGIVDDMMKAHQAGTADVDNVHKCIESICSSVVSVLNSAARLYVPECHKGFFQVLVERRIKSP